jgi:hypothetical protein
MRLCPGCGEAVPDKGYCAECGADLWRGPRSSPEETLAAFDRLLAQARERRGIPPPPVPPSEVQSSSYAGAQYITLTEAAKLLPGRRPGKATSVRTVWRYCTCGIHKGIRLMSVLLGGHRCTTAEWVKEFIEALNRGPDPTAAPTPEIRSPLERRRASERAARELEAEWERSRPGRR